MAVFYLYFEGGHKSSVTADSFGDAFKVIKKEAASIVDFDMFPYYNLAKLVNVNEEEDIYTWNKTFNVWESFEDKPKVAFEYHYDTLDDYLDDVKALIPHLILINLGLKPDKAYVFVVNILQRLRITNPINNIVFIPHNALLLIDGAPFPLEEYAFDKYKQWLNNDPFSLWPVSSLSLRILPHEIKETWLVFGKETDVFTPPQLLVQRSYALENRIVWEMTSIHSSPQPPSKTREEYSDRYQNTLGNVVIERAVKDIDGSISGLNDFDCWPSVYPPS